MIYADTSVLSSLVVNDSNRSRSLELVSRARRPFAFSELHRLEVENSIALCVASRRMTEREASLSHQKVAGLVKGGKWAEVDFRWEQVFARAFGLSRAHTSRISSRSLDILHVACAMDLGLREFWSFDVKQRRLAELVGLKVNPLE